MNRSDIVLTAIVGLSLPWVAWESGGPSCLHGVVDGQPGSGPTVPPSSPAGDKPEPASKSKPQGAGSMQPSSDAGSKVEEPAKPQDDPAYALGFVVKDINGQDVNLEKYKGRVVVMVNVASRCGYTTQYEGLQRLYEKHKEEGLVVLGFPANNFGGQEPGTDAEIREFCSSKYGVMFPMFSKISVKGEDQHPLYKRLSSQPAPIGGDPKWNFTKFIVDRSGKVVARFNSNARPDETGDPDSKAMADVIAALLASRE